MFTCDTCPLTWHTVVLHRNKTDKLNKNRRRGKAVAPVRTIISYFSVIDLHALVLGRKVGHETNLQQRLS